MGSDNNKVVTLLREAYWAELESMMNYLANAVAIEGIRAEEVAEDLRAEAEDEFGHAREISERLEILDSVPEGADGLDPVQDFLVPPEETTTDVESVIDGVVSAEREAIDLYSELAEAAEDTGDRSTRRLAERLLEDEEEHLDLFESYQKEEF